MPNPLIQPNEALVQVTIVSGNPAELVKDEMFDPKGHYVAEIGATVNGKSAQKLEAAQNVALAHGEEHTFGGYSLAAPRVPCYNGDSEALRKPLAEGKLVVKTKSSTKPLLIGTDGTEVSDPKCWAPGAKAKALVCFYPYHVNNTDGVSASIKFMALIEEAKTISLFDKATAMLADYGEED